MELRQHSGGKPVGFKLAVGKRPEFIAICQAMLQTGITPDFITIDGGEGGTGAAPVEFANSVGMPLKDALHFVHSALVGCGLRDRVKLIASGKSLTAFHLFRLKALGADSVNSGRGMMFALGCIQSKNCNTNRCPTGVATQDPSRYKMLDIDDKAQRVANYHSSVIYHFNQLLSASGLCSHDQIASSDVFDRLNAETVVTLANIYPVLEKGCLLNDETRPEPWKTWWDSASPACWEARLNVSE